MCARACVCVRARACVNVCVFRSQKKCDVFVFAVVQAFLLYGLFSLFFKRLGVVTGR